MTTSDTRIPASSTPRQQRRADIGEQLLDGLEALVRRHRDLRGTVERDPAHGTLHAELITAEVAQQLALARAALWRTPPVAPAAVPSPAAVPPGPAPTDRQETR